MYDDKIIKFKIKNNLFTVSESHLHQHSDVREHIREGLIKFLELNEEHIEGQTFKVEIDLGRVIGKTTCVSTENLDSKDIFYAQRRGRETLTKFIQNVAPVDSNNICFVMVKTQYKYKILTAYIGNLAEKEPLDKSIKTPEEFEVSKKFWDTHALTEGSQRIYNNTKTTECPWTDFESRPKIVLGNKNNIKEIIHKLREENNKDEDIKPKI